MAQIRQEINIVDAQVTILASNSASAIVQLDPPQYNGTVTYYFEAVCSSSAGTPTLSLRRNGTSTNDATVTTSTTVARLRSSSFTPVAGFTTEYIIYNNGEGGNSITVRAARIIIIQNASPITTTETQIEIGNQETGKTNTTDTALTDPKYWLYKVANWNGTKTFFAEVTYNNSSSKLSTTIKLQEDNGSFGSWADKVTIVSAGTATAATRIRSASFTPTDGRNYRIVTAGSSSKSTHSVYNAKIVVDQNADIGKIDPIAGLGTNLVLGSSGTTEATAQAFRTNIAYSITGVKLVINKSGSPTDNLIVDLVSTLDGASLASGSIAGADISGTDNQYVITFGTPYTITAGSIYYIQLTRSGARDVSNYFQLRRNNNIEYVPGNSWNRASGVWSDRGVGFDLYFELQGSISAVINSFELQYLLLNRSDIGTGLQTYNTLYDIDEWSGINLSFRHAQDATNAADSTKLTDITANPDVDLTNSTVTGANQQISQPITGLIDNDEIDSNVITSTGVVGASRILVQVSPLISWMHPVNESQLDDFPENQPNMEMMMGSHYPFPTSAIAQTVYPARMSLMGIGF